MQAEWLVNNICFSQSGGWKSELRQPGGEILVRNNFSLALTWQKRPGNSVGSPVVVVVV